ncbi:inositol phosphorylceramide synthase catalytic subunit [Entomortierella parvispora]|uniref:Inositol phosphorylceramide synthase catalytic subunit n=1 Tax=Entomortierella parvispora TaxID=205924 RepID=A0A9P3H4T5_9FUNG|nr:inositol phosphorylceramide synthase catalytic subunit [Entomortierella parvispora]
MLSVTNVNLRYRKIHKATKAALVSTIRPLRKHRYTLYDLQYVFLFVVFTFCYFIMDKPVWFKLPIASFAVGLLVPKRTRPFMLPFLAIAAWLILFYCCRFIPSSWRPHIFTSVLPALENILYGGNISEQLATATTPLKDLLAWMPYGVLHFVLPVITAVLIVFFGPPGTLPVFARTFGYMNVAGVLTQLFFPCAPPWYESRYGGLEPATYTMPGDPGGLARVDDILGTNMYKSTFTASPMVFGAFPSLHSACAWQLAFFLVYIFGPRSIPFAVGYVFWIWWATMYLGHHYVVDLVGGAGYAVVAFWFGSFFLPSMLPQQHYNNAKASHVIHDLGDAMNHQEKQTLFDAAHEDDFVGFKNSKEWDLSDSYDQEDDTVEMADVIVVSVESQVEERKESHSEPSSPTSVTSSPKKNAAFRQSWNGWQGYESWMEVLSTVNSPRVSPRSSPDSSPRNSTTHHHGHRHSRRLSRDSIRSVTTLNLDSEAGSSLIQGSSSNAAFSSPLASPSKRDSFLNSVSMSLSRIDEDAGSSKMAGSLAKGRARPSRLFLEQTTGGSFSLPSSPLSEHAELGSTSSLPSSSRPTSPRSFASAPSPALGKRFKDE